MATKNLAARTWTLLTDSDVTAVSVHNPGGYDVWVSPTAGATPPTDFENAWKIPPGGSILTDTPLAVIWAGVTGANRLYAWCDLATDVRVSHA